MKTTLLTLTVVLFMFASCDNENAVNPQPTGIVTISGTIFSDFDEDENAGDLPLEVAPANVPVYFYDDDTDALLGQTTTTATGTYSVGVSIGVRARDIRVVVGDFETNINIFDFNEDDFVSKKALYNDRDQQVIFGAIKDATYIQNIEINQPEVITFD